jgi:hypothetical protein
MKTHARNLLFASAVYVAALIITIVIALAMDVGVFYDGFDPDTVMFVLSVFFMTLASWAVYFGFYLMQRHIADHDINAKFIGIVPRIIGGLLASLVSAGILFACFYLVSEEGEPESILAMNVTLAGVIIGLFTVVNFVNFIVFKPRQ